MNFVSFWPWRLSTCCSPPPPPSPAHHLSRIMNNVNSDWLIMLTTNQHPEPTTGGWVSPLSLIPSEVSPHLLQGDFPCHCCFRLAPMGIKARVVCEAYCNNCCEIRYINKIWLIVQIVHPLGHKGSNCQVTGIFIYFLLTAPAIGERPPKLICCLRGNHCRYMPSFMLIGSHGLR